MSGLDNVFNVFGNNLPQMLQAWSLSFYTDDDTQGVDPMYTQPSWNFRSMYPALPTGAQPYPLAFAVLADGVAQSSTLQGGSSAFYRFSITTGTNAAILLTSNGWMPPASVQATIVRTR